MKTEREKKEREQLHDDLLAVLAASRELPADHDDALADLILERVEQPIPVAGPRAPMPQGIARRADPVPILITLVIATVLSLASAMVNHSSVEDSLMLWFFVVCVFSGVVQIGLYLGATRVSARPLRLD